MIYRKLGRTGMDVGVIGLGCEYIWHSPLEDVVAVLHEAIDHGVNYFDIFMPTPQIRDYIGYALKGKRDLVMLAGHLGSAEKDGQYFKTRDRDICDDYIKQLYDRIQTDYIDLLFLHNCDDIEDYERIFESGGLFDRALQLKKEGKARFIGFSSHNTRIALKAVNSGLIDVLMFPINPIFDALPRDTGVNSLWDENYWEPLTEAEKLSYPTKSDLYHACTQHDVGLVAMKPYAAGLLFKENNPGSLAISPVQCLSYILSQPGVSTAVPGCKNTGEVRAALAYLDATDAERDFSIINAGDLWKYKGRCMYCNHCLPCPVGIDVAATTRLKDTAEYEMTDLLRAHYAALPVSASDCIACGSCTERCPFGVDVVKNMQRAQLLFGY